MRRSSFIAIIILFTIGICAALKSDAQMRAPSVFWLFKELTYRAVKGEVKYGIKFGPQIVSTNSSFFVKGGSVTGIFTPYHCIDYRLVVELTSKTFNNVELKKIFVSSENAHWILNADVCDSNGHVIKSFEIKRNDVDIIDNYCSCFELELGRIDVSSKQVNKALSVKLKCAGSASDKLLECIANGSIRAKVCCVLPFFPMDM